MHTGRNKTNESIPPHKPCERILAQPAVERLWRKGPDATPQNFMPGAASAKHTLVPLGFPCHEQRAEGSEYIFSIQARTFGDR